MRISINAALRSAGLSNFTDRVLSSEEKNSLADSGNQSGAKSPVGSICKKSIWATRPQEPTPFDDFHPRPPKPGKNVAFMDGHVAPM